MFEMFVESLNSHRLYAFGNQIADGIVDHGRGDSSLQAKAVSQVGCAVEFAAADMDQAFRRLAERHDSGIQAMNQRPHGNEIQCAFSTDVQTDSTHTFPPKNTNFHLAGNHSEV